MGRFIFCRIADWRVVLLISPIALKYGGPVVALLLAILAFNLWLGGVKRAAFNEGRESVIAELEAETQALKAEFEKEADALRQRLAEKDADYARDIASLTRQTLNSASPERLSVSADIVGMLNARTDRANADIAASAAGFNDDLPAASDARR